MEPIIRYTRQDDGRFRLMIYKHSENSPIVIQDQELPEVYRDIKGPSVTPKSSRSGVLIKTLQEEASMIRILKDHGVADDKLQLAISEFWKNTKEVVK